MRAILFFTFLLPTLVYADPIIFSCNTEKHTIKIPIKKHTLISLGINQKK